LLEYENNVKSLKLRSNDRKGKLKKAFVYFWSKVSYDFLMKMLTMIWGPSPTIFYEGKATNMH